MKRFFDNLIPPPRRIMTQAGVLQPPDGLSIALRQADDPTTAEFHAFCAGALGARLKATGKGALAVDAQLAPDRLTDLIPRNAREEAYELAIARGVTLRAATLAGLRHGIQTLRQLLENAEAFGYLPRCRIIDWPRLAHRGIHFDLAREMEYRPVYLRRVVEKLAYLKLNTLHLYLENKFVYPSAPEVAPPGVMTPAEAQALCRYARRRGVTIIPQIPTLGHMEHFLHGRYARLREDPKDPFNLCPTHPGARPLLAGLIADVAAAFAPPYIHVGYDESHSGVCRRCRQHGVPPEILADHLNWLNEEVKRHGARTMIYGDKFLSPEDFPCADAVSGGRAAEARAALRRVSRDIIIADWHYTAPYGGTTQYLTRAGFEVHMVSATNIYWHDAIPLNRGHHWIVRTIDAGIANGASGAFNSNWEYYQGQFFDNFWYFQGLAAERMWTDAPHDYLTWGRRFASRFWGVDEDYYAEIGGLAETIATRRRRLFSVGHVLEVDHCNAALCHEELGDYLIERARRFRRMARRHADTLRLLDMPGQVIRYTGIRARQRLLLANALRRGAQAAAVAALRTMARATAQVAGRLKEGYRVYGGAVLDRERIAWHRRTLTRAIGIVRQASAKKLKAMTIDQLVARLDEPAPEHPISPGLRADRE